MGGCWRAPSQVSEVAAVRKGLLALRQNVLLLQDDTDPAAFYPRWEAGQQSLERRLGIPPGSAGPNHSPSRLRTAHRLRHKAKARIKQI
jgi:hypothetical protein